MIAFTKFGSSILDFLSSHSWRSPNGLEQILQLFHFTWDYLGGILLGITQMERQKCRSI